MKGRTKLTIVRSTLWLGMAMLTSVLLESDQGKTISLGLSSEGGVEGYVLSFRNVIFRRPLRGGRVLLGLCHTEPIKAHNITYGEVTQL